MPTPHNAAQKSDFAATVLMPGDPLRARYVAEHYLTAPREVTAVRGMLGYTGTYRGVPVSVMGSGMGMPSIGIYSYELFTEYGVENIIRIGSAGAYDARAAVFDVVLASGAYSESSFAHTYDGFAGHTAMPSEALNAVLRAAAQREGVPLLSGMLHSSDVFYRAPDAAEQEPYWQVLNREQGCIAVEMESFALFHVAASLGKNAACLVTISDSFVSHVVTSAKERETGFDRMIRTALASVEG